MNQTKNYDIGLDIGVGSVGWTITDSQSQKVLKVKGKQGIGVRLFNEGQTAEERRQFRTNRRRLKRRKWRLRLLRELFDEPISSIDPEFFARLKYFNESSKDPKNKGYQPQLHDDLADVDFYRQYPTIYHLRHALMTQKEKFDIRDIYLAVHHIVKYRGHFLMNGHSSSFSVAQTDWKADLTKLFELIQETRTNLDFSFDLTEIDTIKSLLFDKNLSRNDRQKEIVGLINNNSQLDKKDKALAKQLVESVVKGIVGMKTRTDILLGYEVDNKEQSKAWTFSIDELDDQMATIDPALSQNSQAHDIITLIQKLYMTVQLAQIVPEGQSVSEMMINRYNLYAEQLQQLKDYKKINLETGLLLREAYDELMTKALTAAPGKTIHDTFYNKVKKILKDQDNKQALSIKQAIEDGNYLIPLRIKSNGVIPYQLHQRELDAIIENQKEFYPFLATPNPVDGHQEAFPYKLDELIGFKVPYYVGPMVDPEVDSDQNFAWMVRKEKGEITPWNFHNKVDVTQSADNFIKRMKTTDTYLIGEDVLPQNSLLYQRYTVLNELNGIKVANKKLTIEQKQRLYDQLFKKKKTVKKQDILNNLVAAGEIHEDDNLTGLSNGTTFNNNLGSYIDYCKIIGQDKLEDASKQADIERIIEWSTTFEDANIFLTKLAEVDWLTEDQRQKLSQIRYRGWGQFSKTLLTDIKDNKDNSIIDNLMSTKKVFMQIINDTTIKQKIDDYNQYHLNHADLKDTIANLFTSPQNKRAINQTLLVIEDIINAVGHKPTRIFIESAKDNRNAKNQLTQSRLKRIVKQFEDNKQHVDQSVYEELKQLDDGSHASIDDRLLLYFLQNGKDMYTGQPIDISQLSTSQYHIDHILPQAKVMDNALDNRVLVSSKANTEKSDRFLSEIPQFQQRSLWAELERMGFLTKAKKERLLMTSDEFKQNSVRFIARQLVETRQIIKLVNQLIIQEHPEVKLVNIKADLTNAFRKKFNFVKNRNANDYHHAFDAYLTSLIGSHLLKSHPKWEPLFVYSDYDKIKFDNAPQGVNIMKEFEQSKLADENGEIIWNKDEMMAYLERLYNSRQILITKKVYARHGNLFKQTIFKAGESDNLIPVKNNRSDIAIYGGYKSKQVSYYALISLHNKKRQKRLVAVYLIDIQKLQNLNESDYFKTLHTIIKERHNIKPEFDILADKIYQNQLIIDNKNGSNRPFRIEGDFKNDRQLYLPLQYQRWLASKEPTDEKLNRIFDHICEQLADYFPLFAGNACDKLLANRDKFYQLSIKSEFNDKGKLIAEGKLSVIDKLLVAMHANSGSSNLKTLSLSSEWGRFKMSKGNAEIEAPIQLIHQSPTGLFKRIQRFN